MVHAWGAQHTPDTGIDEVVSGGTGQEEVEGEAVAQELVVDKKQKTKMGQKIRESCA